MGYESCTELRLQGPPWEIHAHVVGQLHLFTHIRWSFEFVFNLARICSAMFHFPHIFVRKGKDPVLKLLGIFLS